jgi:hypothetical protein
MTAPHHHHHHGAQDPACDHGHSHGVLAPHPASAVLPSLLRLSLAGRLGIAGFASALLWGAVWFAMR